MHVPIYPLDKRCEYDVFLQRTRQFTDILLNATTQTPATSDSPMSAANARQVARSFESCVSNPIAVDDASLVEYCLSEIWRKQIIFCFDFFSNVVQIYFH